MRVEEPGETLALTSLDFELALGLRQGRDWMSLGERHLHWPSGDRRGMLVSPVERSSSHTIQVAFLLNPEQLHAVEAQADTAGLSALYLKVSVSPSFACLRWTGNSLPSGRTEHREEPAGPRQPPHWMGLVSETLPVWYARASDLTVTVSRERWAESILQAVGRERDRKAFQRIVLMPEQGREAKRNSQPVWWSDTECPAPRRRRMPVPF